jgi:hypothetical protein
MSKIDLWWPRSADQQVRPPPFDLSHARGEEVIGLASDGDDDDYLHPLCPAFPLFCVALRHSLETL